MKLVPYVRVSTQKQGASGLGLEGQKAAVEAYAKGTNAQIVQPPFVEVESGKLSDRPELLKALATCKAMRAVLCVAKLDRLSRNVAFLSALMESGVEFVACDNPNANRLTLHILAAVAENEAKAISERTKAALKAYKSRGGVLGASREECRNLTSEGRRRGNEASTKARQEKAKEVYTAVMPIIKQMQGEGKSLRAIADELNRQGFLTSRGTSFNHVQVHNLLKA